MLKKSLSILLACVLLLTSFSFVLSASAAEDPYPTLYIRGQGDVIYSKEGKVLYDGKRVPVSDVKISEMIDVCVPLFIKAVTLGQWDEYRETALGYWAPIYQDIILDKNGEPSNGSHNATQWKHYDEKPNHQFGSYFFVQDWRLDPMYNADLINTCISEIKEMTGKDKVNLIARCEGANVAFAYLAKYGYDSVNLLSVHASSVNGIDAIGALFSGKLDFTPERIAEWVNSDVAIDDPAIAAFVSQTVDYLVDSYGFEGACNMLELACPLLYKQIGVDIVMTSYGTFPGMWALVGPDYYADARALMFKGRETEYAGLIEKLDAYDKAVRQRADEILLEAKAAGVKIQIITKYGDFAPQAPVAKELSEYHDKAISVKHASFGATSSKMHETFDKRYLAKADPKYLSPDKHIDASTCVLPDQSWFVYGAEHNNFDTILDTLIGAFLNANGEISVFDDPAFPQYLKYTSSGLVPLTEEDAATPDTDKTPRFFRVIVKFFAFMRSLIDFIKGLLG